MTMLHFLKSVLAIACFTTLFCGQAKADEPTRLDARPNILWLTAEDIGPQLSCYGDSTAATPNLDQLAKRGMVYDLAWSNYPVCAPARTTIVTGMYAASNGAGNMRSSAQLPASITMFPEILRAAGYTCYNNSKEDYNHPKTGKVWDDSSRRAHYRNRRPGKPFFSVFNNTQTHESRIRTRPHEAIVSPAQVKLPPYWPDLPEVRQDWAQYYDNLQKLDRWIGNKLKELGASGEAENTIVIFFGDHGSGMPRHKRYAGDSGMRVPLIVYFPEPLRHLAPDGYRPGGRSNRPVGFVDLAPSMLSLAEIAPPKYMQGHAFMGKYQRKAPEYVHGYRARMDERIDLSRSMRDDRFLYIRNFMRFVPPGQVINYQMKTPTTAQWKRLHSQAKLNNVQSRFWEAHPAEELYDLQTDPHAVENLAGNQRYRRELLRFRAAMRQQTISIRDAGYIPESELHRLPDKSTIHEFCADPARFPIGEIYDLACAASSGRESDVPALLAGANANNSILRYWAVMGFLNRNRQTVVNHLPMLQRLLDDSCFAVSIVAAETLSRHGDAEMRRQALAKLIQQADLRNSDYFAALQALNAIDRLGDSAAPILDEVRKLPTRVPERKRGGDYLKRMRDHLFADK